MDNKELLARQLLKYSVRQIITRSIQALDDELNQFEQEHNLEDVPMPIQDVKFGCACACGGQDSCACDCHSKNGKKF